MKGFVCILTGLCLLTAFTQGCRSIAYYTTVNSMAHQADALIQADRFSVRPVDFHGADKPGDYVSKAQFLEEMDAEIPEFAEELMHQARGAGLDGRVMMVGAQDPVSSGVIVESFVVEVTQQWDFYKGGADHLLVDLLFKDARSGETLFESRVRTSSLWTNNLAHKMNGSGGRLGIATWNLVRPMLSVMQHGRIVPASW